jgi:DNA-binding NarL/FixJ family response regulator
MIHVALLDDHPAIHAGLRRLIEHEPDLLIVGAAPNAPELARQMGEQRADVLVLDDDLERSDGLSHCRRIKDRPHASAVIIYSAFASHALALVARVAHADAVVDKNEPVSSLLEAIRLVAAGETVLPAIPRDAYETATARLADDDLPVLAMLLGSESLTAIVEACAPIEPRSRGGRSGSSADSGPARRAAEWGKRSRPAAVPCPNCRCIDGAELCDCSDSSDV